MADIVYKLMAAIGLDTSGLKSGLDESERMINISGEQISKALTTAGVAITGALTAIGAGFVSVATATVTAGATYADQMLTMASVTGMSTDQLQAYGYMAELVDVPLETITGTTAKLVSSMNAARKGTEAASTAFRRLGVTYMNEDGSLRDSNDLFLEIVDALGSISNETERDALSMEIFGRSARDLNPLILAGSAGIARFRQEAEDMGYILDQETLASLGAVDDAFQRLANVKTTIFNRLGAGFAPGIERVVDQLVDLSIRVDWEHIGMLFGDVVTKAAELFASFVSSGKLDAWLNLASIWLIGKTIPLQGGATEEQIEQANDLLHSTTTRREFGIALRAVDWEKMTVEPTQEELAAAVSDAVREYAALWVKTNTPESYHRQSELTGETYFDATAYETDRARLNALLADYGEEIQSLTSEQLTSIADGAEVILTGVASAAEGWGADLDASLARGIYANVFRVNGAIENVAKEIASYLHHSEPDTGPLAHDSMWMPDMMRSFADGINSNKGIVVRAMSGLAEDMSGAMNPGGLGLAAGRGGHTFNIYVNGGLDSAETIAEQISSELSALLGREAAALG